MNKILRSEKFGFISPLHAKSQKKERTYKYKLSFAQEKGLDETL